MTTGQVTDVLGRSFDLSLVENGTTRSSGPTTASTLSGSYRLFDSLNLGGNWTWSHTYGNTDG